MAHETEISWCDSTFNPWEGCTKVSPGCAHCYAEARDKRFTGGAHWGKGAPRRRTSASNWKQPLRWNKFSAICNHCAKGFRVAQTHDCAASHHGVNDFHRPRVFCASLADWLDDEVPIEWLADLLKLIHETPNLDWLLLTKRPENWRARIEEAITLWEDAPEHADEMTMFLDSWLDCLDMPERGDIPENIWIGTTVENQEYADKRIPELLKIPARVRFLSCEPLLERVNLEEWIPYAVTGFNEDAYENIEKRELHWVICGGESGHNSRLFDVDWARSLRDQCHSAGVPFFMKQLGANIMGREMDKWVTRIKDKKGGNWDEWPQELRIREFPNL